MDYLLRCSTCMVTPLLVVSSIIVLLSGHNSPGGGFIGGLILGLSFFYKHSVRATALSFKWPVHLMVVGCGTTVLSGLLPLISGQRFLKGMWSSVNLPLFGEIALSNIVLFDIGVFMSVTGVTYLILSLAWEDSNG